MQRKHQQDLSLHDSNIQQTQNRRERLQNEKEHLLTKQTKLKSYLIVKGWNLSP